jgi:hypothetical protein
MKGHRLPVCLVLFLSCALRVSAQQAAGTPAAVSESPSAANAFARAGQTSLPRLVKFSGTVKDTAARPLMGITFALYKDQEGRAALWLETQNVPLENNGHYSVLLGANSSEGLPIELFSTGEARWLGVQPEGQTEQPRVLLVSVAYALKAGDADTLGGKPASEYALSGAPGNIGNNAGVSQMIVAPVTMPTAPSVDSSAAASPTAASACTSITADGTAPLNQLAKFSGPCQIHQSLLADNGTTVSVAGAFNHPSVAAATPTLGQNSFSANFTASSFSSSTHLAVNQLFRWQAEPVGNNTSSPSGKLNLLFASGTGTPGETGLSINNKGLITFASGQTFPTVTGNETITGNETVNGTVSGSQLISTVANGTAPLKVTSTTLVPNLNASLLGGLSANAFAKIGTNTFLGSQFIPGGAGANGVVGIGDAGCGPSTAAIGFGVFALSNCRNWSLFGDGINTVVGRPTGGGLFFEQAGTGVADMQINPDGSVQINGSVGIGGAPRPALVALGGGGASGAANNGAAGISSTGGDAGCCGGSGQQTGIGGTGIIAVGGAGKPSNISLGLGGVGGSFTGGSAADCDLGGVCGADGIHAAPGLASNGKPGGLAGVFFGDIVVNGAITADVKDFKIDHPLDPANKYLVHSSVESSEMMNLYTGNVALDANGEATVPLPSWFQAENADFRYQLTAIGAPGPNLYVVQEVADNQFKIAGGAPGMKVSWQITGIRQDAFAKANPLEVESTKPARERGFYIQPNLFGQPEEKSIEWARHPELMKQIKAMQQKPARSSSARPAPAPSTGKVE